MRRRARSKAEVKDRVGNQRLRSKVEDRVRNRGLKVQGGGLSWESQIEGPRSKIKKFKVEVQGRGSESEGHRQKVHGEHEVEVMMLYGQHRREDSN